MPHIIGSLGEAVERPFLKPLYGGHLNDALLPTFGLTSAIVEIVKLLWRPCDFPCYPPAALEG